MQAGAKRAGVPFQLRTIGVMREVPVHPQGMGPDFPAPLKNEAKGEKYDCS